VSNVWKGGQAIIERCDAPIDAGPDRIFVPIDAAPDRIFVPMDARPDRVEFDGPFDDGGPSPDSTFFND
jgi:hypothetical protein